MRKAVIDVGSNSVILLIGEQSDGSWRFLDERTQVTALGEGTKATGLLGETGMAATLQALKNFFGIAHQAGVSDVSAWATMAARIATNTPDFQARAERQGTPVKILSGEFEAQLGFDSVVQDPTFSSAEVVSIIDPGGQSTELVTAVRQSDGWKIEFKRSFPIGTLALRGDLLKNETPEPSDLLRAVTWLDETIGLEYLPGKGGLGVVLGATGTNLVSIRERYTEWEPLKVHGANLRYDQVATAVSDLSALTDAGRAALVGIEPGRERTVHLGALVLERFMYMAHLLDVKVSVRGWRHALLQNGLPQS